MESETYQKYDRAKKRVKEIRSFYTHLRIFIIVNVLVYVTRFFVLPRLGVLPQDEGFIDWLNWNTYLMPILWGIGLGIHGLRVFASKFRPIKRWEERKINEILKKENENNKYNY